MADKTQDDDLDLFFAAARKGDRARYGAGADSLSAQGADVPTGMEAFLARIEADAFAAQAALQAPAPVATSEEAPAREGWLAQLWSAIGGWPSLAGLATATVAGVWIGISPPAALSAQAAVLTGQSSATSGLESDLYLVDLMPGLYDELTSATDG
ncbi:hypothetical protein [Pseudooceanicola nanhaiensis]|uniref:hypothetical protein n=1 Tax=Pseudooceanicola nanhaiensis TaxID=375761 RepID=UPI001CD4D22B|nr:hypothetical protein [Pseudooceanicola nanhaiensis]MCA0920114.1 hypothetical protein [Pseudooceanicola nanhaiensis]